MTDDNDETLPFFEDNQNERLQAQDQREIHPEEVWEQYE